jgi:soluble lytic murein transglycosylase
MQRITLGLGLTFLLGVAMLLACQRNAPPNQQIAQTSGLSLSPSPSRTSSSTPTDILSSQPTHTPTATPTPTVTSKPTLTPTPTPTFTPIPSARLAAAQQAFTWGDYSRAQTEFAELLADPGADEIEAQLAAYWLGRSALEAGDHQAALTALQDFVLTYPIAPQVAATHFLIARAYEELGDWHRAISAYQAYLDDSDGILAIYAHQGIGDAAMLALDYRRAARAYADGLRVAPDNGWVVQMRESLAQSELAQGNPKAAVEQYDAILRIARIRTYQARILYLAGQALMTAGDTEAAYERYNQTVNRYPEAYDSYQALVELVNADIQVDDFLRGLVDYHARAYQPAIEAFVRYIEANPQHTGDVHWYLALSFKANGNLWQSIQHFQELIDAHPQNEHSTEAWLEMAEAYAWRDDVDRAVQTYNTFADENSQSPLAVTALWQAATLEMTSGDLRKAAESFRDLVARYPDDGGAPEALFRAALLEHRQADFRAARDDWQTLIRDYPDSRAGSAARFWLGKAWLALEEPSQARLAFQAAYEWTPTSYYGLQAADKLGEATVSAASTVFLTATDPANAKAEVEDWLTTWLPITATATFADLDPTIANSPSFRRGEALLIAGRRSDALAEFELIKDAQWDDPLTMYQLALAFRDRGLFRLSIICAERLIWLSPVTSRTEAPALIQRLAYPLHYQDLIVTQARDHAVDPLLLFALIRQESLFEPSVSSHADARGLTQVIPTTGEWIADRIGWSDWDEDDLSLPYVNVQLGAWYLGLQLSTFQGEIIPALAAYNAGPGNAQKWLEETPDLDLFVETMPFGESRRYIRNVYENYGHYRRLYRPES